MDDKDLIKALDHHRSLSNRIIINQGKKIRHLQMQLQLAMLALKKLETETNDRDRERHTG